MKETLYKLNLDQDFDPFYKFSSAYNLEFKLDYFPGGETNFRIESKLSKNVVENSTLLISQRFKTATDVVNILIATDAANRIGFKDIRLMIPYFPAARQDRVCNDGESLTLKIFADMINSCGFSEVFIFSPHSEVTPALINNVTVLNEHSYVLTALQKIFRESKDSTINVVCPDAGAGKRVGKVIEYLLEQFPSNTINLIRCEKNRNVRTGTLEGFYVMSDDLGGHSTIIIDDIVAYGGTFIGLGEKLREKNCGKLALFTSHADCNKGLSNMIEFFDHVITTNSRKNTINSNKLITLDIQL